MSQALLINITDPDHHSKLSKIILKGGIVGAIWGHHLYFLACNAYDTNATSKMNKIKGRPQSQVFASPGAVHEAAEFADIQNCQGLLLAAKSLSMKPLGYLEFLFKKFPIAVELFAKDNLPSSITFATKNGQTVWIAAHMGDKHYSKFLQTIRALRKEGHKIIFAGTSLNLKEENTLTVRDFDKVLKHFGPHLDAISYHPGAKKLKKLRYSTSSSAVSFIGKKPKLLRLGSSSVKTLKKYIPSLQVPLKTSSTRKK